MTPRPDADSRGTLELRDVSVRYGDAPALRGVTLSLRPGVTALLGPNGAGKTTLMKVAAGLHGPTSGEVALGGRSCEGAAGRAHLRAGTGFLPQGASQPPHFTVAEVLTYAAWLKRVDPARLGSWSRRRWRGSA